MSKYKIEVSYTRVRDVEAESLGDARMTAKHQVAEELAQRDDLSDVFDAREYEEPKNWEKEAQEDARYLADDLKSEVEEAVRTYRDSKTGDNDDPEEYDDEDVKAIFDEIYHEEDTYSRAWEYADGHFIYNSTDALTEAMHCIDELDNYASGDSGLWEGKTDYWDIINIQAADAYKGAVHAFAEDIIKERIAEMLGV